MGGTQICVVHLESTHEKFFEWDWQDCVKRDQPLTPKEYDEFEIQCIRNMI